MSAEMDEGTCEGASTWKETLATINRKPKKGNAWVKSKNAKCYISHGEELFFQRRQEERDLK